MNCKNWDDKYSKNSLIRNPVLEISLAVLFLYKGAISKNSWKIS